MSRILRHCLTLRIADLTVAPLDRGENELVWATIGNLHSTAPSLLPRDLMSAIGT